MFFGNKKTKNENGGTIHEKQPVLGMLERGKSEIVEKPHKILKERIVKERVIEQNSRIYAEVVPNRHKETILPIIYSNVENESTIMTDEYSAYNDLKKDYTHATVNHGAKEYVNQMAHTNGIEGFWSHMKRGIDGIYHWVSKSHLQSYVDEFALRFNTRNFDTQSRFDLILSDVAGKRLTYKKLIK